MGATMDSKSLLLLTEDVMEKIDEHRGPLSRAEFVGWCIDTCLESKEANSVGSLAEANAPVALWIPSSLKLPAAPGAVLQPSQPLAPIDVAAAAYAVPYQASFGDGSSEEPAEQEDTATIVMWVMALLLFGFGDTLTTVLIIATGGFELNPLARMLLGLPGGVWAFTMLKIVVIGLLVFVSQVGFGAYKWVVPTITSAAGLILVINNFRVLVKMQ